MILLTSADFIRGITNISNNTQDKFLLSAIRESQEMGFQSIVGSKLYTHLQDLVSGGTISDDSNSYFKNLLDLAQYFLAYDSISNLCVITNFKINNIGVNTTTDENVQTLSMKETLQLEDYYRKKADYYQKRVQDYILRYYNQFAAYLDENYFEVHSNLDSAANTSIFLGGARGKGVGRDKHKGYDFPND